jgi:hypothetical protein
MKKRGHRLRRSRSLSCSQGLLFASVPGEEAAEYKMYLSCILYRKDKEEKRVTNLPNGVGVFPSLGSAHKDWTRLILKDIVHPNASIIKSSANKIGLLGVEIQTHHSRLSLVDVLGV